MLFWKLEAACGCHRGRVRENNEDNFYFDGMYMPVNNDGLSEVFHFFHELKNETTLAVFDGMGGGDYGEIASFLAAEHMKEVLEIDGKPKNTAEFLRIVCRGMNQKVYDKQMELDNYRIGSTVAGIYFMKHDVHVFNLGDSRIYQLRKNKLEQVSKNHTNEQYLREHGIIGRKPRLLQHLGMNPEEIQLEPYIVKIRFQKGDRYLLCSDGLTDMVSDDKIAQILLENRSIKEQTEILMQMALERGGKDNITVILCQIH